MCNQKHTIKKKKDKSEACLPAPIHLLIEILAL